MVKIGSGIFKGRNIKTPATNLTRVSTSYFRKVIFDTLSPFLLEAKVLDLFAGSGALGIEAISRGAQSVLFIDSEIKPYRAIKENIDTLELKDFATVLKKDVFTFMATHKEPYDLIFLDPPYKTHLDQVLLLLKTIDRKKLLSKEGALCIEIPSSYKNSITNISFETFKIFKDKTKGETSILFYSFGSDE